MEHSNFNLDLLTIAKKKKYYVCFNSTHNFIHLLMIHRQKDRQTFYINNFFRYPCHLKTSKFLEYRKCDFFKLQYCLFLRLKIVKSSLRFYIFCAFLKRIRINEVIKFIWIYSIVERCQYLFIDLINTIAIQHDGVQKFWIWISRTALTNNIS